MISWKCTLGVRVFLTWILVDHFQYVELKGEARLWYLLNLFVEVVRLAVEVSWLEEQPF